MKQRCLVTLLGIAAIMIGPSPLRAQTPFQTYHCRDGSEFVVAFFKGDRAAHVQLDGKALALKRRPSISGARYTRGTVALMITKTTTTLVRGLRSTECSAG
jgi:membrane-bound inhibitor of C-type lysozyme